MHIAIIGAGIIGIQTAHALLDEGHVVTLIDPDGLGQRTSRGNAGGIVHTDILPLASPRVWRHIPRWLVDPLGPFAIRPAYLPSILPWLLRFVRASTPAQVERSTQALIALNGLSLAAWERRLGKLGLEQKHLRRLGDACTFSSKQQFEAALPTLRRQEKLGYQFELLSDHAAVKRLEPAFGSAAVAGVDYPAGVDARWTILRASPLPSERRRSDAGPRWCGARSSAWRRLLPVSRCNWARGAYLPTWP